MERPIRADKIKSHGPQRRFKDECQSEVVGERVSASCAEVWPWCRGVRLVLERAPVRTELAMVAR